MNPNALYYRLHFIVIHIETVCRHTYTILAALTLSEEQFRSRFIFFCPWVQPIFGPLYPPYSNHNGNMCTFYAYCNPVLPDLSHMHLLPSSSYMLWKHLNQGLPPLASQYMFDEHKINDRTSGGSWRQATSQTRRPLSILGECPVMGYGVAENPQYCFFCSWRDGAHVRLGSARRECWGESWDH